MLALLIENSTPARGYDAPPGFQARGWTTRTVQDHDQAIECLKTAESGFDVVIIHLNFEASEGEPRIAHPAFGATATLIERIRKTDDQIPILIWGNQVASLRSQPGLLPHATYFVRNEEIDFWDRVLTCIGLSSRLRMNA